MKIMYGIVIALIFGIVGLLIWGGPSEATRERSQRESYSGYIAQLDYIKDERSGLCFGYRQMYQDTLFVNVPCEKVEHLIKGKYVEAHYENEK